jgi:UDP-N-acetyl-D-mannosaminuronic acid dehydrogenase
MNNKPFQSVSMIGLGYIGLPTAAVLASQGVNVNGVDVNQYAVDTINAGNIHIVEPNLKDLVHEVVFSGKLRADTKPKESDAFLIAVPTPLNVNRTPDLFYVEAAAISIAPALKKGDLVILESTSPVGTTEKIAQLLAKERPDLSFPHQVGESADVNIAYCPERVLPGNIIHELVTNDRIVGGMTSRCSSRAALLYKIFVKGDCIITNVRTAEMCKLTENSFRDVNIAFANELSIICEEINVNVWELIRLANRHPRVNILQPGPGVGGHCIAVDPWFIVDKSPKTSKLIRAAREVNDSKPNYVITKVKAAVTGINNPIIACLGLTFKADVDDVRESPSLAIVQCLKDENIGNIYVVEPYMTELPLSLTGDNVYLVDLENAIAKADVVLLLVDHQVFNGVSESMLAGKVVIDTRGLWYV